CSSDLDAITGVHRIGDYAEGEYVGDLAERLLLVAHLLIDAEEVFLAAQYTTGQVFAGKTEFERGLHLLHQLLAVAAGAAHGGFDKRRAHGVQHVEAALFELHAEVVHAQAVGDGRVDVDGFLGDAAAFVGRQHVERAHVVQTVGQFDENDAD